MTEAHAVFDTPLVLARRRRRFGQSGADFLLRRAAEDMADRIGGITRSFSSVYDLGTPGEALREQLGVSGIAVTALEPDAALAGARANSLALPEPEALGLAPGSADLIASALYLQQVNDLPGLLAQARRALKPDGLFLASFLGGTSLTELRQSFLAAESALIGGVSPHVAPFVDVREAGGLLQRAGFALPVVDTDTVTVRYADVFGLMRDLRAMGLNNALAERSRRPLRRAVLFAMAAHYADTFADADGRIRATFEIVHVSGWAPHASQQKPLKPGSAQKHLSEVLGPGSAGHPRTS